MKKNNKNLGSLIYLILPLILILVIGYFTTTQNVTKVKYCEIVNLFKTGQVTEYSLTIRSGALTYKVKGDNTVKKYTLPSVELFLNDIHDDVMAYNDQHPDNPIIYDYKAGANNSVWASILPMLLLSAAFIFAMYYLMKRMEKTITNENNMTLSFGKARAKLSKDEKRKTTFNDVAGADEERQSLKKSSIS